MADIDWPDGLPGPLVSNTSTEEVIGFIESDLASGAAFITPISEDNPTFINLTFQFKRGDDRMFRYFLRQNNFKVYSPWFNLPITFSDRTITTQEVRFTADGYPQLASITTGGVFTYNARVIAREIEYGDEDDYPNAFETMWTIGNGNYDYAASKIDEAING